MFEKIWLNFIGFITSRLMVLLVVICGIGGFLCYRTFQLQIVNGADFLENFQLKIEKERVIPAIRGNIYDCNGKLLAYNELAYSVTIEDVYASSSNKNEELNKTIYDTIQLIESQGDSIISEFGVTLDQYNRYTFVNEGTSLTRFLADVYGHASTKDLTYKQSISTPDDVVNYLCSKQRFGIGAYTVEGDSTSFEPGYGYSKKEILKLIAIRYNMSLNSFQKYIATTIATNVNQKTVAVIMENSDRLAGVSIAEDTIRKYNYSTYISQIVGYTGKVSQEELENLKETDVSYDLNDTVGKSGIEASMEMVLQGKKGLETVFVDNVGKVMETSNYTNPQAGQDVYLTIDVDLQKAATDILEQKLAGILLAKIRNVKEYNATQNSGSSDIIIPIYDVYYALINNNVIDISHFNKRGASETEQAVQAAFEDKLERVLDYLQTELLEKKTPYQDLPLEYRVYQSYITAQMYSSGVLMNSVVDRNDPTYINWTTEETISLNEYLNYAIAKQWVDVSALTMVNQYSDTNEIYENLVSYILDFLRDNEEFARKIYKYMIKGDEISGKQLCRILLDQNIVIVSDEEAMALDSGATTAYSFVTKRIENLEITPAQLALDPCSGSIVVTDVNTGEVKALVSYPSYDNNKMANGVDAEYYAQIRKSQASPLINYATYQKTAPGSTFKMVSTTAGILEGVVDVSSTIQCTGVFDKLDQPARCWIYPGAHGLMNAANAITNSCNCYFYEVGYRMSQVGEAYNSEIGLNSLRKYADLYGLTAKSGIEIEEAEPEVSDMDPVRSAIGQGTNNYTTVGLARYVTTVANSGTCYNLTLIDKITDNDGILVEKNQAEVRNYVDLDSSYWKAIHQGMRGVVERKAYYADLDVKVAGKTGTAQESKSRPNHALFVSYAPYEAPEIAMAVRVANGYSSDYAAQIAREVYKYCFGLAPVEDIVSGSAEALDGGVTNND